VSRVVGFRLGHHPAGVRHRGEIRDVVSRLFHRLATDADVMRRGSNNDAPLGHPHFVEGEFFGSAQEYRDDQPWWSAGITHDRICAVPGRPGGRPQRGRLSRGGEPRGRLTSQRASRILDDGPSSSFSRTGWPTTATEWGEWYRSNVRRPGSDERVGEHVFGTALGNRFRSATSVSCPRKQSPTTGCSSFGARDLRTRVVGRDHPVRLQLISVRLAVPTNR
jgi:hypothetical protein